MVSNTVDASNLNPFDPQIMISRYVTVATLAIFVWDLLNNILNDYKLLSKFRIRFPTVVYFFSRTFSLGYIVCTTILKTAAIDSCYWLGKISNVFLFLCGPSTSLLFFFRIRAVFDRNPWIVAFFLGLWLANVGTSVMVIVGTEEMHLGTTRYCTDKVKSFVMIATVVPVINDTLIFLAITWRLYTNSYARPTLRDGLQVVLFGDYLPRLSRVMLQDGQAYYLTTITGSLIAVITIYTHSIPPILRTIVWIPNVVLMNIMACRVFRNTLFGYFRETEISTSFIVREQREHTTLPSWAGESGHTSQETGQEGHVEK